MVARRTLKKYSFLIAGLSLLFFVAAILFITAISMTSTTEVEVLVTPASATLTIDGKEYQNGTFRLATGDHQIHIEKDGFIGKDYVFNTSSTKLYDYLTQTDGTDSWYIDHEDDALLLTKIGDYLAGIESQQYNQTYPIVSILPVIYANYDKDYNYTEYRIDGGSFDTCDSSFCLKITDVTGGNLEPAKAQIKAAGYNPDEYQIIYEYTPITEL